MMTNMKSFEIIWRLGGFAGLRMGFKDIPITSVFTAAILAGYPFLEVPGRLETSAFRACGV